MDLTGLDVAVLGAGIGGLAAALALAARGASVTVHEQSAEIKEVGAGLQISPNGFRVIAALGLGDALRACSVQGQAVSLRRMDSGSQVARLDLTRLPDSQSYHFVHRADLIDLLAQAVAARGIAVRLGDKVTAVSPHVTLASGNTVVAELIVGADGLHSVMRPALNGAAPAKFTGQVAWRATVPNTRAHPTEARVHMGAGRHIVTYPLRGGSLVNIVAVEERKSWTAEGWAHTDTGAALRAAFPKTSADLAGLLDVVETPGLWGLFRHPVAQTWVNDRCALLGDAAHPTLPFLAQGANMALEDAWSLSRSLADAPDQASGLHAYQMARRPRVSRVIEAANGNAWKYHLPPGPARFAAHTGLSVVSRVAPSLLLRQFDWLYGYDVTA